MDTNFPRYEAEAAMLEAALANSLHQVTTDSVRERVNCPATCNPKNFGEVVAQIKANGLIRKVGHVATERKVAHGREIGVWQLVDVDVARKRLEQLHQLLKEKAERVVGATRPVQKKLF